MKRTVGLLLILALLCGGCSLMLQSGLTAGNSQRIESAHGFAFRVPSDWLMEEVDAEHVQYRFHSAEEDIYLTVVMELGELAYDSTTEIGAALAEQLRQISMMKWRQNGRKRRKPPIVVCCAAWMRMAQRSSASYISTRPLFRRVIIFCSGY